MPHLEQKNIFKTNFYEFREKGLFISIKSFSDKYEEEIPFEDISNRTSKSFKKETVYIYLSAAFISAGILALFRGGWELAIAFILIGLGFLVIMKLTVKNVVNLYVRDNQILELKADKPGKAEVETFLEDLKTTKKNYLINKYASIDKDLPIDGQLNNLVWLKNSDYISEMEFNELKNQLLGRVNDKKIGF